MHSLNSARNPVISVEAENEHFEICDAIISWNEQVKGATFDQNQSSLNFSEEPGKEQSENHDTKLNKNTQEAGDVLTKKNTQVNLSEYAQSLRNILPTSRTPHHHLSATGLGWNLAMIFSKSNPSLSNYIITNNSSCVNDLYNNTNDMNQNQNLTNCNYSNHTSNALNNNMTHNNNNNNNDDIDINLVNIVNIVNDNDMINDNNDDVLMRGNDEWAPPRAQIIFIVHEDQSFRKCMQKQKYRCAGCGSKIDIDMARRLVLYCHYFGKYFCKCCFSHKSINLPGYMLQKWDFHKYPVSYFALQLLDRISNEPLFNINDINPPLYKKVKKLRNLIDIRLQLYYLKIYITSCTQENESLIDEFKSFSHDHLLADDLHVYSLNNLIEIQHGKLYEYLADLVSRSIEHIAHCDRCRAKGHYCQLCGPSSTLINSMIVNNNNAQQFADSGTGEAQNAVVSGSSSSIISSQMSSSVATTPTTSNPFVTGPGQANSSPIVTSCLSVGGSTSNNGPATALEHELIFPFEIGRVAQCGTCGCCFHLQCFLEAGQKCPKCERIQRRRADLQLQQHQDC